MDALDGARVVFWSAPRSDDIRSYVEMTDDNGEVCLVAGQPPSVDATILSRPAIIDRLGRSLLADKAAWEAQDAGRVRTRGEQAAKRADTLAALITSGLDEEVAEAILPAVTPYAGSKYQTPPGIEHHFATQYLLSQEEVGTVLSYLTE